MRDLDTEFVEWWEKSARRLDAMRVGILVSEATDPGASVETVTAAHDKVVEWEAWLRGRLAAVA